jgi:hypothetical protein
VGQDFFIFLLKYFLLRCLRIIQYFGFRLFAIHLIQCSFIGQTPSGYIKQEINSLETSCDGQDKEMYRKEQAGAPTMPLSVIRGNNEFEDFPPKRGISYMV